MKEINRDLNTTKALETFIEKRRVFAVESSRIDGLVEKYKREVPSISAHWDTSDASVQFNDIDANRLAKGVAIYACEMEVLWGGLFEPAVYDGETLWRDSHDQRKIAKVIDAWVQAHKLSPLYLVKHGGDLNLGLVADGKHRLTVSRAIGAREVPFIVEVLDEGWVAKAFPTAKRLQEIHPSGLRKSDSLR